MSRVWVSGVPRRGCLGGVDVQGGLGLWARV